jgi:hypothetical protein
MNYDDIIHLPHPVSTRHAAMSNRDRAAQFAPFAALTGYEGELAETARLTTPRIELTENEEDRLNAVYLYLQAHITEHPRVTITYFEPDGRKSGGAYITLTAPVKRLDEHTQTLILTTGETIPMAQILTIEKAFPLFASF